MSVAPQEETEPLLPRQQPATPEQGLSRWTRPSSAVKKLWSDQSTPILCYTFFLQFLISFAKHIVEVPRIRLFELAACHAYYQQQQDAVGHGFHDNLDDRLCKVPAVQNELSTLTGWQFAFDAVYADLSPISVETVAKQYLQTWASPGNLLRFYCRKIRPQTRPATLLHRNASQSRLDSARLLVRWPGSRPSHLAVLPFHLDWWRPTSCQSNAVHHRF